jgi:PKD repeat protein
MVLRNKKRTIGIGIMLVLTSFVGMTVNVSAGNLIAEANGPYTGYECQDLDLYASGSSGPGGLYTYSWYFNKDSADEITIIEDGTGIETDWLPLDNYVGTLTLVVSNGTSTAMDTAAVTVLNVAPTITSVKGPHVVDLGDPLSLIVNYYDGFNDPVRGLIFSLDTYTTTFDWGDGSSTEISSGVIPGWEIEGDSVTGNHIYNELGIYHIIITLTDDDGGFATAEWYVLVDGSFALVWAGPDKTIDEGSTFISAGFLADDSGAYTADVGYGDGAESEPISFNTGNTFDLHHQYSDNGIYTVFVTVYNEEGEEWGSGSAIVTILNVAPTAALSNDGPKGEGSAVAVSFSGQYDPGIFDTLTYSFDWNNDGTYDIIDQATMSATHTWNDNGLYTVKGMIKDKDGGFNEYTTIVNVLNIAPTAVLSNNGPKNEWSPVTVSFTNQYDPGIYDLFTYSFDWNNDGIYEIIDQSSASAMNTWNGGGTYTVQGMIKDNDGGFTEYTTMVDVLNLVPTAVLSNDGPKDEGSAVTVWFGDPGIPGPFTYSFDWDNDGTYEIIDQPGNSATHTWYDEGMYMVKGRIKDATGDYAESTTMVSILNVAPTALLSNDGPKGEGSAVTVSFSGQYDPGSLDTFMYSFDWNNDGSYEIVDQAAISATYTWYDNGLYMVKGRIKDNDGGFTEYTTAIIVNNVPPTITSLSGPPTDPVPLGTAISLNGVFTDPGTLDSHVALIEWGDGQTTSVNLAAGIYQVSGSHTYASAGVYMITLTVTDKDNGYDKKSIESYVVVYDVNGGFVTGGGWVIAPPGSYPADPTLSGRCNFGFVSKYKKGQTVPEGNTEFQFHPIGLNFHSHTYEWLVITIPIAMYRGTGTINGAGNYGFVVTVLDGKILGGGAPDQFRIRIWDKNNGDMVVFDNLLTDLSGGQITIHQK